jgi:hypothetical protein
MRIKGSNYKFKDQYRLIKAEGFQAISQGTALRDNIIQVIKP